jgi:hypothetical protein
MVFLLSGKVGRQSSTGFFQEKSTSLRKNCGQPGDNPEVFQACGFPAHSANTFAAGFPTTNFIYKLLKTKDFLNYPQFYSWLIFFFQAFKLKKEKTRQRQKNRLLPIGFSAIACFWLLARPWKNCGQSVENFKAKAKLFFFPIRQTRMPTGFKAKFFGSSD